MDVRVINDLVQQQSAFVETLSAEVSKVIVGQKTMVERLLIGLLTGGHVLLEGVPGLAKTLTVKTLADALDMLLEAEALSRTTAVPAQAVCGRALMNIATLARAR